VIGVRATSVRHWWIALGAGFVLLVIYLSLTPDPLQAPTVDEFKTGHILAYLWCMLWFAQAWRGVRERLAVATLLVALGIALEYAQRETGYRHFSYSDMVDDAIGVGAGWLLACTPLGNVLERKRR
jgi:VanZ family protein